MSLIVNTFAFETADQFTLLGVERAHADERDALERRRRPVVGSRTRRPRRPSAAASGMPWTLPLGEVSGRLRSPCASIQSAPPGAVHARHAAERAHRDRVVAAQDERHEAAPARLLDERRRRARTSA